MGPTTLWPGSRRPMRGSCTTSKRNCTWRLGKPFISDCRGRIRPTGEDNQVIYLCEREIGFDAVEIGFPSVMGCRAIVLVTAGGLFGYHLNGNLNAMKQAAFVNFVTAHV